MGMCLRGEEGEQMHRTPRLGRVFGVRDEGKKRGMCPA